HHRAFSLFHLVAATVADEHRFTRHRRPPSQGSIFGKSTETRNALSGLACTSNSPRTQQTEHGLFFRRETYLARFDDAQMPRAKIIDRSPVEVLLDNGRRHVRLARHCRRISEPLGDAPHDRGHRPLLFAFRLRKSLFAYALGEVDRREERAAPGA